MVYARTVEYLLDKKDKEFTEVFEKLCELNKGASRDIKTVDDHFVYLTFKEGINTQFEDLRQRMLTARAPKIAQKSYENFVQFFY